MVFGQVGQYLGLTASPESSKDSNIADVLGPTLTKKDGWQEQKKGQQQKEMMEDVLEAYRPPYHHVCRQGLQLF